MTKDEALRMALEALEPMEDSRDDTAIQRSITAIREALAEQPAQGCEFCSHPLYAGTKCKNCGREQPAIKQDLTPEQPAQQQEPIRDDDVCTDCGMEHCECGEKDD